MKCPVPKGIDKKWTEEETVSTALALQCMNIEFLLYVDPTLVVSLKYKRHKSFAETVCERS